MNKIKQNNKLTFWLFNAGNIICTLAIIFTAMSCLSDTNPSEAFHISLYAMFQAMFSLMLNVLFHKAAKDKEVYLDD